jgi:sporulation protein YlmC with PRC-barrel domain
MDQMKRSILTGAMTAFCCLGLAAPLLAAPPAATGTENQASNDNKSAAAKPAEKCLSDMRAMMDKMSNEGYWLGGLGYGYGYPMAGFGFGPPMTDPGSTQEGNGSAYLNARPGYELRTLLSAAGILARQGQQQPCEDVLATSRDIYQAYVAELHGTKAPTVDLQSWRRQQIAAAQPVAAMNTTSRSDTLLGTEVRNPQNDALGSVDDLMTNPQTGKIDYVVIARGGVFGIDEKYVPVPWAAFKIAPNLSLLVLSTTKDALSSAPQASKAEFTLPGRFNALGQKVDSYWKTHLSDKGSD